jgi:hypothetical protein
MSYDTNKTIFFVNITKLVLVAEVHKALSGVVKRGEA